MTAVTTDHLNHLLKLILRLIMKHIGDEKAEWLTNIAVHAQQIIINTSEDLLKDPILPLAEKVRKRVETVFHKEESCRAYLKAAADDASQVEGEIQEEWGLVAKDIYAFYPLLIKYVDLQRAQWIRHNVHEAESLYNHVGEIFNILTTSTVRACMLLLCFGQSHCFQFQYFRREEQNFVISNEIDTMALIMPSAGARNRATLAADPSQMSSGGGGGDTGASRGGAAKVRSLFKESSYGSRQRF